MSGAEGPNAIGDFIGWYTYLQSGEPFSEYRGRYPNLATSAEEIQKMLDMTGSGVSLDDYKDMLIDASFTAKDFITAAGTMTPVQFIDMYENPALNPALSALGTPEEIYGQIKSGDTAALQNAIAPQMDRLKEGLKQNTLTELLMMFPGLTDNRGNGEALSELFRDFMQSDGEIASMIAEFAIASVIEVSQDFGDLMAKHGDEQSAQAWRTTMQRATSIAAQKEMQPDVDYSYSYEPPTPRNILTDTFNAKAMDTVQIVTNDLENDAWNIKLIALKELSELELQGLETDQDYVEAIYTKFFTPNGNLEETHQDLPTDTINALENIAQLKRMIDTTYKTSADYDKIEELESQKTQIEHTLSM
ncbi:MAG: hypothetical protein ACRBCT_09655 [Alphaproteobacteria bacterium]